MKHLVQIESGIDTAPIREALAYNEDLWHVNPRHVTVDTRPSRTHTLYLRQAVRANAPAHLWVGGHRGNTRERARTARLATPRSHPHRPSTCRRPRSRTRPGATRPPPAWRGGRQPPRRRDVLRDPRPIPPRHRQRAAREHPHRRGRRGGLPPGEPLAHRQHGAARRPELFGRQSRPSHLRCPATVPGPVNSLITAPVPQSTPNDSSNPFSHPQVCRTREGQSRERKHRAPPLAARIIAKQPTADTPTDKPHHGEPPTWPRPQTAPRKRRFASSS